MSVTLLQVVNRVRRNLQLDATITAFTELDESLDNVQDVNEAYEELIFALPPETPFMTGSGAIVTANGTRTYTLAGDAMPWDLYTWSFIDQSNGYFPLRLVTKEWIEQYDPKFNAVPVAKPQFVYPESLQNIGLYPIPDGTYTINYLYKKNLLTRVNNPPDVFIVPDRWVRFIEKRAQEKYERRKAYADPDSTEGEAEALLAMVIVEAWESSPTYLLEEGF